MFDYRIVKNGLLILHQAASSFAGWEKELAEEFIRVGEYPLALDEISYAYLNNKKSMPGGLFEIFERLAVKMDVEEDNVFKGVAQLRAETKGASELTVLNS